MAENNYHVQGMHCASCAQIIKSRLEKLPGIHQVHVNYASEEAQIEFSKKDISVNEMNHELKKFGYGLRTAKQDNQLQATPNHSEQESFLFTVPIAVFVFLTMIYDLVASATKLPALPIPMTVMNIFLLLSASLVLFGPGSRFLSALIRFGRYGTANMDTLIGLGTASAYLYLSLIHI